MPISDREKMRALVVDNGHVVDPAEMAKAKAKGDIPAVDDKAAVVASTDDELDERNEPLGEVETTDAEIDDDENETEVEEKEIEEKEPEPKKISQAAADRRIAKAKREAAAAIAERDALLQQIAALERKDAKTDLTPEEVERLADAKAEQKAAQKIYDNACNNMYNQAGKEFGKNFDTQYKELIDDVGALPRSVIAPMLDMDDGHLILSYLVKNPDDAEKLLGMTPAKQVRELVEIGLKLSAASKKTISRVPAPIVPLGGRQKSTGGDLPSDRDSDDAWIAKRQATKRERVFR